MNPIRVAQIIGKMCAGGVESVVFNYYRHMDHNVVQFDFYYDADSSVAPTQELIDMGARFIEIPPYQKIWKYLPAMLRHFKENRYQIVHSHMNSLSVFPLCMAWLAGVPVRIAHNHSTPGGNEKGKNALKMILKRFSKLFATDYFACSDKAGRWLFGDRRVEAGEVAVIKNAIDFQRFAHDQTVADEVRRELKLEKAFIVGHVGRITYAKNHHFLIDIFGEIKQTERSAKLLLVGDGELRKEIEIYAAKKNVADSVIFMGAVSNPERYYQVFDVLVFPSHFEGLGMAVIEAQVSGIPCVVSEAVPEEARISNGCRFLKLSDGAKAWADKAVKMQGWNVLLTEKVEEHNLEKKAGVLQGMYLQMLPEGNECR